MYQNQTKMVAQKSRYGLNSGLNCTVAYGTGVCVETEREKERVLKCKAIAILLNYEKKHIHSVSGETLRQAPPSSFNLKWLQGDKFN